MFDVMALPALPAVSPCSLVMHQLKCRYCQQSSSVGSISALHYNHGIMCCNTTECMNKGYRDVNAYFHIMNLALFHDVIKMFPNINLETISIVRSDGTINQGKIVEDSIERRCLFKKVDSDWYIPVTFVTDHGFQAYKDMPITNFTYSGVPQETIDTLIETLNQGIYKNDYDAHMQARIN
jgi:hypothetical protein